MSLSARRAWIEIAIISARMAATCVALRKESVDRNIFTHILMYGRVGVALRKESVDRNVRLLMCFWLCGLSLSARRAWIEITLCLLFRLAAGSLSARRAWIEIIMFVNLRVVDGSLSARRAWIEIPAGCWRDARRAVALRKESVDRNA